MKNYFLLCLFLFSFFNAQTKDGTDVSNFNMTSFTYKHNSKWSAYIELQTRSLEDFMKPDYYEIKGGPSYNFNKNNAILVGIGKYGTYQDSDLYQKELRIWLQYTLSHKWDRLKIDHRFRAEKRFFDYPQDGTKKNDERFRYRLSLTLPLNSEKIQPGTIFANAFEEIFLVPNDQEFFKRTRTFGGFGYQVNNSINANLGYMFQKEFSSLKGNTVYNFVYLALNFTLDRQKLHDFKAPIPVAD